MFLYTCSVRNSIMRRLSGTKAMPARRAAAVERKRTGLPSSVSVPAVRRALAEQRARQFDLAAAHEAVDAGDLATAGASSDMSRIIRAVG